MAKLSEKKIFTNGDIIFGPNACDCEIDKIHPEKGVIKNIIRLYPKNYKHRYAYKNGKELVSIKADGTVIEKAVLPDFLAIKDNETIKKFIEIHGYPFPFEPNTDNSLETEFLFSSIHRLDATVNLMAILGEEGNDYEKILALTLYLLLAPQTSIKLPGGYETFLTYQHDMCRVWSGTYRADYPSSMCTKITALFEDAKNVEKHCRLAINFLYNFCKDVGEIETWSYDGKLTFVDNSQPISEIFREKLDEQLREGLLKLAKQTLKAEIEGNLGGIKPSYNTETMAPAWRIEYLLSGIYFSLFNIRAKDEQYRVCARPNCGRYFLTKTDSTKQKYCSYSCSNATAQKVHRSKKTAVVKEKDVAFLLDSNLSSKEKSQALKALKRKTTKEQEKNKLNLTNA